MEQQQISALIGASAAIIAMLATQGFQWLRDRGSRSSAARAARADRLRVIYIDVMTAALRATPAALQYRPSGGPAMLTANDANHIRARLSIEAEEDGQAVLTAFIGVVNFSGLYEGQAESRKDHPDRVPQKEMHATEKIIRDNMAKLEEACRRRLSSLSS